MKIRPLYAILGLIIVAILVMALPLLLKLKRYQSDANRAGTVDIDLSSVRRGLYRLV